MDRKSTNHHSPPTQIGAATTPSINMHHASTGTSVTQVLSPRQTSLPLNMANAKSQSASDHILMAMQNLAQNSNTHRSPTSTPTPTKFPFQDLPSAQTLLSNPQFAGAQQLLTIPSSPATGQQQILLPITNSAGQQQLISIPVTLAQGQGGVQFLIPTSAGQLLTSNLAGLQALTGQASQLAATNPITASQIAANQIQAAAQLANQVMANQALASHTASHTTTSTTSPLHRTTSTSKSHTSLPSMVNFTSMGTLPANTPLPPMSVLASQAGLPMPAPMTQMLMNANGQVLTMSPSFNSVGMQGITGSAAMAGLARLASPKSSQVTTSAPTSPLSLTSYAVATRGLPSLPVSIKNEVHVQMPTKTTSLPNATTVLKTPPTTTVTTTSITTPSITTNGVKGHDSPVHVTSNHTLTSQALANAGLSTHILPSLNSQVGVSQSLPAGLTNNLASVHGLPSQIGVGGQLIAGQMVGGQLITSQGTVVSQGGILGQTSVASPSSNPLGNLAVSSLGNTTEVDGINLEEIKEFAKQFKIRRLSLGLTQTQVGQALSATEGPSYSQSAICRFEKLDITPKSAQKIKPVLERWMEEAEERHKNGVSQLTDFIGSESTKKRKRRTSFTPQALEYLNSHFEKNTHPSGQDMTELSGKLGYDREVIRVWFCNKRQALKNTIKKLKSEPSGI
ncbi:POU domain, class 6, transcription factor 2-like [Anneissia japonica]|uniref:POU domain, class 6, transcription factor 2-like n=1 Tax=Anneissia japonica TaxID=1529436 RepID=UPI00142594FE|nr:POU domain, class 6, transcription factor 2-like [Anneissia japonica]